MQGCNELGVCWGPGQLNMLKMQMLIGRSLPHVCTVPCVFYVFSATPLAALGCCDVVACQHHFSPSFPFPPPPSCLQVRCFRPWSLQHFMAVLPATASRICVLDRTKESGALAEPLYLDVIATLAEHEVRRSADPSLKVGVGGGGGMSLQRGRYRCREAEAEGAEECFERVERWQSPCTWTLSPPWLSTR